MNDAGTNELRVLAVLDKYGGACGNGWIAFVTRLRTRSVRRALERCVAAGLVEECVVEDSAAYRRRPF